ncbi:MAG: hypothetical protein AAGI69_16855 [Cyanobacteria bacterium P01_H01_bin.21]
MPKNAVRDIIDVFPLGSRAAERPSQGVWGTRWDPTQPIWHLVNIVKNNCEYWLIGDGAAQGFPP